MSMSLKDFSLMKEDDGSYTVGHPHGKSIVVPKKGLSDKAQKLISQLKKHQNFDEGGEVDLPTEVTENSSSRPAPDDFSGMETAPTAQEEAQEEVEEAPQTDMPEQVTASAEQQAAPQVTPGVEPSTATASPPPSPPQSPFVPSSKPLEQEQKDISSAQKDLESAKKQSESAELPEIESPLDIDKRNQDKSNALMQSFADKKINPNRFWENKSTGSKIAGVIGIILGGMGAAFTGSKNTALEIINNAIDRDIDAQKNDQSKAMNLWKMNREAVGDEKLSALHTKEQSLAAAKFQVDQAAHMSTNALQKAQLAQTSSQLGMQMQDLNRKASLMQFNNQPGKSSMDPAMLVKSFIPEHQQPEAYKELGRIQRLRKVSPQIVQAYDEAVKYIKDNNKTMPLANLYESGAVKRYRQLLNTVITDTTGTARQAEFESAAHNLVPTMLDSLSSDRLAGQRKGLNQFLQSAGESPLLEGNGIHLDKFLSTSPNVSKDLFKPGQIVSVNGRK